MTSQERKDLIALARGLLAIAATMMPDTYYATDSRCQHARNVLARFKQLPKSEQRFLDDGHD